jgi:hypothetical protein
MNNKRKKKRDGSAARESGFNKRKVLVLET